MGLAIDGARMNSIWLLRVRLGLIGILLCVASCTAFAQQIPFPTKEDRPPAAPVDADKPPESSALAATEAGLRHDLELEPDSAPLLYRLGLVLRQENKPKDSLEIYTRAAKLAKPDAGQLRSVALDYVLIGDFDDAIHWLQIAESFDPQNVDVLYSLGRCLYSQDRFPEAKAMFLRVLELRPDHLKAEENLGLVYDFVNEPEKAEAALRQAATWAGQESTDKWPFLDLGGFLLDHAREAEAVPLLQRAVSIDAKCAACHEKLGRALVAVHDTNGGVKELEAATELDPKNPKTHYELGIAYRDEGVLDKARAEFALSQSLYGQHSQN
jgi:tetratricopeptide (TPR) repeat protein